MIEDCIAEQPGENSAYTVTVIGMMGYEPADSGRMAFNRAPVIRNCYVNCAYKNGLSSQWRAIESITQIGGDQRKWRVRTVAPHYRTIDNNVLISGVLIVPVPPTLPFFSLVFNGVFSIDNVHSDYEFDITLPADPDGPNNESKAAIGAWFNGVGRRFGDRRSADRQSHLRYEGGSGLS